MDARMEKGMMIAATMRIQRSGNAFIVPSQSLNGRYAVDGLAKTCSCPDYELRRQPCKHVHAVEFYLKRETVTDPNGATTVTETAAVRITYGQNWPAYNQAQTTEKAHFLTLLRDLCNGVINPPQGNGRPHLPIGDQLFCLAFKVYSGMSARRFATDLREAHADGLISDAPAYNSVIRYFEDESLTPVIHDLIATSAKPLATVETQFAVDSTGLGTQCFYRHYSAKYGHDQMNRDYIKVHAMIGTKTNVVTAVAITDRDANDGPQFPALVERTSEHFNVVEVSADKAYSTKLNLVRWSPFFGQVGKLKSLRRSEEEERWRSANSTVGNSRRRWCCRL